MKRLLVTAGEPSGDLHASRLIREIRKLRADVHVFGLGGDRMGSEGADILYTPDDLDIVGFQEAVLKLRRIRRIMAGLARAGRTADLAVLVDYPGFNLRLARHLKAQGVRTVYYIVPQVWAWGSWRVRWLRRYVDQALCILPFEEAFLRRFGVKARYVGHPVIDILEDETDGTTLGPMDEPVVALLPGSRGDEVKRLMPRMLEIRRRISERRPDVRFLLSSVPDVHVPEERNLTVIRGRARDILRASDVAVLASGTVSLEAGLLGTPMIVLYMLSEVSWRLVRLLARVRYASLVNLLLGSRVVPEHLQHVDPDAIAREVLDLLENPAERERITGALSRLWSLLGRESASRKAARVVCSMLDGKS
jgi:lipid-A-disaccharide synthase